MLEDRDVAVVQGNMLNKGGVEVVSAEIARAFDAKLYVGFSEPEICEERFSDIEYQRLFKNTFWRRLRNRQAFRDFYYMWAFQHVPELHDYDVVIQSGNEPGWYVPAADQVVLRYVHGTPHTAYDFFHERGGSRKAKIYGLAARTLYPPTVDYADRLIANSEIVRRRIERYWRVESDRIEVVYPPVDVSEYETSKDSGGYYLTLSRLVPQKRIDEIVRTFTEEHQDKRLVVAGTGPASENLKDIAGSNVEFVGFVQGEEKKNLLSKAKAFVFNADRESFGITPIEAFASGLPVIGVKDGYTQYQVIDGQNGLLYDRGGLSHAIERFEQEGVELNRDEIAKFSKRYGVETFREKIRSAVKSAVDDSEVVVEYGDI